MYRVNLYWVNPVFSAKNPVIGNRPGKFAKLRRISQTTIFFFVNRKNHDFFFFFKWLINCRLIAMHWAPFAIAMATAATGQA